MISAAKMAEKYESIMIVEVKVVFLILISEFLLFCFQPKPQAQFMQIIEQNVVS